ncbi:MAG TPA: glycogen-binding domain-containing protein, partial [Longimicrobiales bacterium]|nr:glycogen-binding domain-containing protein [Longimicrobiales bacterium]
TGGWSSIPAALVLWAALLAPPVAAQTAATLGMSASVVEYEGFLASGAAVLTPALRYDAADLSIGAQASWTVFESGNQILQATAAAGWLARLHARWRFELSGAGGVSRYADEPGSSHLLARSRLHFSTERTGAWLGATTGMSVDGSAQQPVELSVGAWSVRNRTAIVGTVTNTWMGADRFLDVLGAVRWTHERVELEARVGARPWTVASAGLGEPHTTMFGELSALLQVARRISLAFSAGSYPADPVRRLLAAKYASAGITLTMIKPEARSVPILADARIAAARDHSASASTTVPQIELGSAGSERMLRVIVANAAMVELMGDFTDWEPIALTRVSAGIWEVRAPLAPGTHRLNIRVDGGEWVVPSGARSESGEFGTAVGVIVVR